MPPVGALERQRLHQPEHAVLGRHVAGLERRRDQPVRRGDGDEAPLARARRAPSRRTWRAGTGSSAGSPAARPSGPRGTRRSARRAGSRRWRRPRRGAPKRSSAASTAARLPSRVVRSAASGSPGPSSAGLRSTASTSKPSSASALGDRAADPAGRAGDDGRAPVAHAGFPVCRHGILIRESTNGRVTRRGVPACPLSRSPLRSSTAAVGRRVLDGGLESWRAAVDASLSLLGRCGRRGATPLDVAADLLALVDGDHRPPRRPSGPRPTRSRSSRRVARLRDFIAGPRGRVVPTLVFRPRPATTPASSTTAASRARSRPSARPG